MRSPSDSAEAPAGRGKAERAERRRTAILEALEDRAVPASVVANGLLAQYYNEINLTGLAVTRQDPNVNFDFGTGSPSPVVAPDTFSARWTGQIAPRYSENYTFELRSDDGVRLWVDNKLIIDRWVDQAVATSTGTITLQAGRRYDIRLEYYEKDGPASVQLFWASPSQAREIVPQSALYSTIRGDSQYILTTRIQLWQEAEAQAKARGGNLVTINDAAEETFLRQTFGTTEQFWTGLNDAAVEGQFVWSSGQAATYRNFATGKPDNRPVTPQGEDYVGTNFSPSGKWNDYDATIGLRGIIEIPLDSVPPTPTPAGLALATSELTVDETGGAVNIGIVRTQNTAEQVSVQYRTVDGTARAGSDFTTVSGTVTFAPGETTKSIRIPILNDAAIEGAETFAFVIDNVTGNGSLLAPRTATITIRDDEAPLTRLIGVSSFTDASALAFNGSAKLQGGALRLTDTVNSQAGSAYNRAPLEVTANTSFSTRFRFRAPGGTNGADGLSFLIQNAPAGLAALGGGAGGLGYSGIPRSLAVEFDTWQNPGDPSNNHVAIVTGGNINAPLATAPSPVDLNGGQEVYAWVDYDAPTKRLSVFVGGTATKPATPLLTQTVDLAATLGTQGFLGFTGATGGANNAHEILDWEFSSNGKLLPPPPAPVTVSTETRYSGLVSPTGIDWSNDGRNLYIAEQRGTVRVVRDGTLLPSFALDFTDRVNGVRDRGLLDIAVHPNLATNPYLYLTYTYDPPEVYQNQSDPLAGPDQKGNRPARITRVTLNAATNYTTIVPNSEVVLVGKNSTWANVNAFKNSTDDFTVPASGVRADGTNVQDFIATDSESHTIGALEFGRDGMLYATIGDGTSYNRVDPRGVRVQDIDNLSGKLLRIDPITGRGLTDNPFYDGNPDSNRSKVFQYGFRNPYRFGIDSQTGRIYIGDVGWNSWEEIDTGPAGANFGWPYFEGGSGGQSLRTGGYQDLAQAQQFYSSGRTVTAPLLGLSHAGDGINAIVVGDVYRGTAYPSQYNGRIFYNDLGRGIVKTVKLAADGRVEAIEDFATGATLVVQMKQGPDGTMWFVDLDNGTVGRWVIR